jgi:hypothetical protein
MGVTARRPQRLIRPDQQKPNLAFGASAPHTNADATHAYRLGVMPALRRRR